MIDGGTTSVIVPSGGTEQNGPHLVLGKHNLRMKVGAERIARALGNTLVTPVMAYAPEGSIDPPTGHMRFAGTLSIPSQVFGLVLEYTARSLRAHGFINIIFIGDSGPNQAQMQQVADRLNDEWDSEPTRILFVSAWYKAGTVNFSLLLKSQGETLGVIGSHAGLLDTALSMAMTPNAVRNDRLLAGKGVNVDGVSGDSRGANHSQGRQGYDLMFDAAMTQIRELLIER